MVRFLILFNFSLDIFDSPFWKETGSLTMRKSWQSEVFGDGIESLKHCKEIFICVVKMEGLGLRENWRCCSSRTTAHDSRLCQRSPGVLEVCFSIGKCFLPAHKLAGFESPTFHLVVRAALEAGKRAAGKSRSAKEPLTLDSIQSLAKFYNRPEAKLEQICFLFTVLVGYAEFMRMDEILSVRCIDIQFGETFMTIFVPKRKDDQHREGHTVDVAFSGKISCPVLITKRLLRLLPNSEDSCTPIVRRIIANRKSNKFHPSLGISYATARF